MISRRAQVWREALRGDGVYDRLRMAWIDGWTANLRSLGPLNNNTPAAWTSHETPRVTSSP